jgi:hypothetical protein
MRVLTVIAVLLAGRASSLCAQHRGEIEFGGYGSHIWYDHRLQLDNQFGVGGRLGFFLGEHFSLEIDGNVSQPLSTYSGVGRTTVALGSASLVISSGGLFILGGYSRLHMGPGAPYASDLNAVHAGLGERIFFVSDRAALRLEGRAYYRPPGGNPGTVDRVLHLTANAGMSFMIGPDGR